MVPVFYWIVAGVLLVWNAIGCFACYSQLAISAEKLARLPDKQRQAWLDQPPTIKAAYVVAVSTGLLGAIALLFRSFAAGPLFIASLVAVIVQFGWFFVVYRGVAKFGPSSLAFPSFIALIALVQIGFACCAKTQGWLG